MLNRANALIGRIRQNRKSSPTVLTPARPAPPSRTLAFTADFSSQDQWAASSSWASPDQVPTAGGAGDNRLDHRVTDPTYSRRGTFKATRRGNGTWRTGLLTTEGSNEGFTVRTSDVLKARVRLPSKLGAWPAIRTWRDGGNEIRIFEYHPDHPTVLEFSNEVNGGGYAYSNPSIQPGALVDLQVEFGAESVIWWVNGIRAHSDVGGVGIDWFAHLIVNLSVCAGKHHPAPEQSVSCMSYKVDHLRVYRPTLC
ncbi:beta-glucanase [Streptomyces sp. 7N604]|uniref:beta-glucanase n=1 Tax=Streptomyces sp. 7N604 TaxID=3457415 RepID=UPI003FD5157C